MSPRSPKAVLFSLAVAAGALLLFDWSVRKEWQTKPMAPAKKRAAARSAKPLGLNPGGISGKTMAEAWADFTRDGAPKLSREQLEAYADEHGRDAVSLLVAARLSGDLDYLQEAALLNPGDPLVQLEIALCPAASPEERRAALAVFRAVDPDNALGDYLGAHLAFTQGDYATAASGLLASLDHGTLADHSAQILAGTEAAFLSSGQDPLTAQLAAMATLTRPTLAPLREVSRQLDGLKDEFIRAEDYDAAHPTVLVGLDLGQKIQAQAPYLIDQLVGMSIERTFLVQLDPLTAVGGGQTAAERLAALEAKKTDIQAMTSAFGEAAPKMDAATSKEYFARMRRDGELSAMKWVLGK